MHIQKLLLATLIGLSVPAHGDFVTVVEAYEVQLSDLRLPENANGTLAFKPCSDCGYQTVRVNAATEYEANNRRLSLSDFREELQRVNDPATHSVTVMHHLELDTITALRVNF